MEGGGWTVGGGRWKMEGRKWRLEWKVECRGWKCRVEGGMEGGSGRWKVEFLPSTSTFHVWYSTLAPIRINLMTNLRHFTIEPSFKDISAALTEILFFE